VPRLAARLPGLSGGLDLGGPRGTPGHADRHRSRIGAIDVPRWRQERGNPLNWRLGHIVPVIVIIVLAIVGAAATITTSFGGLYWQAAATAAGLINSWVLLVEIKR